MEKICQKCGSPASQIPPKAEWGTEVTSQKTGKKYYTFLKCDNCSWSLSSDPKPRRFTQKQNNSPKISDSSDKFQQLIAQLDRIEGEVMTQGLQISAIEVLLKMDKKYEI